MNEFKNILHHKIVELEKLIVEREGDSYKITQDIIRYINSNNSNKNLCRTIYSKLTELEIHLVKFTGDNCVEKEINEIKNFCLEKMHQK